MINKLFVYHASGVDPYENLAAEQYLLETVEPGCCILYLWQNKNTVVIGKNQNAWSECRVSLLEEAGGKLARRLSGGGAVFHDLGNLNFTFLVRDEDYDLDRQFSVIQAACALAGIETERSGRNDVLTGGRKFSGNAFYHSKGRSYHHGTLLVSSDMDKLQRYLSPPKAKLESKGVRSVRSRVVNLSELSPGLDCEKMRQYMQKAFSQIYGLPVQALTLSPAALDTIGRYTKKNQDWGYLFGTPLPFTFECQRHFPWGNIQLQLQAKNGVITAARVYSDAMDWSLPTLIEETLTGCRFCREDILRRLDAISDETVRTDLRTLIAEQDL